MALKMQRACHMRFCDDAIAKRRYPTIVLAIAPDTALSLVTLTHERGSDVEMVRCEMQTCCVPSINWTREATWRRNKKYQTKQQNG